MSLVEQSQQWFPTSVQVTVHQARNLRVKGKNGTNDAYAIMQVAKDKFSTSVAEKCVAPVWKEEASFDLPLFHPGNAERCTLYIIVMHRAQVGLDKFLGQAVVNLLHLHDNKSRKKTDWFKLVDKSGKEDKARGEVLLDLLFMRNNMSASMFDLSMQDKPRSRISKLKDKVRGKKKDGFSDSASAIVPSVSQVLTDSEGEADAQSLNQSPGLKKKSKLKSLFAPKSNLQRNISQSMSTLGTLPEKNSSLSGSRSSGLNVDSPEVKKKFKFLGHKRTGSSDSKVSQGPFSLLGRSKQSNSDLNNLCINGSHVYAEEAEAKSGSTLSLNSSGQGSVEDVNKHTSDVSAGFHKHEPEPTYRHESTDVALVEQQRHREEEGRREAEERRIAEAKRLEEEKKYEVELKILKEEEERRHQEAQDRKKRFLEDEARRKRQMEEEDEERRKQEEENRMLQAAESQRLEEEQRKVEEQKRQEDASMSERLSTLFGMIRKKEEKKEELPKEELPTPAAHLDLRNVDQRSTLHSTNPFEDIPLSSEPTISGNESPADQQKSSGNPQTPSAPVFLNRIPKVSAVKPRWAQSLEFEPPESLTLSQSCPSPATSESTHCSVLSESPDTFSNLHSSLALQNISPSLSGSPCGSIENLSSLETDESSPTMADKKRQALLPPTYTVHGKQTGENHVPVREMKTHAYIEADELQQGKKMSLPLPDYESLFPQKRHGVQGQTRWDHIIAEVNQKHRDTVPEFLGPEMSVDGPGENEPSRSSISQESRYQTQLDKNKPLSSKKFAAPTPPKHVMSSQSSTDSTHFQNQNTAHQSVKRPNISAGPVNTDISSRESISGMSRDGGRKHLPPTTTPAPRLSNRLDTSLPENQRKTQSTINKEVPTARPRQRVSGKEQTQQEDSALTPDTNMHSNSQSPFSQSMRSVDKIDGKVKDNLSDFDPFPSTELLPKEPWVQPKQNQEVNDLFTGNTQKEQKPENRGMTADDFDNMFSQEKPADPFGSSKGTDSGKQGEVRTDERVSFHLFQRENSLRQRQALSSKTQSDNKGLKAREEPANKEGTSNTGANQSPLTRNVMTESISLQPQADVKTQSGVYRGGDQFGAGSFTVPSATTSSDPPRLVIEEPAGSLSWGKTPLQAWISPSEVQPASAKSSTVAGGPALSARRPHPVKPLTTVEIQHANSTQAVKEIKVWDSTPGKIKVAESGDSGPYTQLTQEELITLVVKQQTDLSKKDAKIVELEEYIDNLVLRVIEEQPSILHALNSAKPG